MLFLLLIISLEYSNKKKINLFLLCNLFFINTRLSNFKKHIQLFFELIPLIKIQGPDLCFEIFLIQEQFFLYHYLDKYYYDFLLH